jgi:hypothetical protein
MILKKGTIPDHPSAYVVVFRSVMSKDTDDKKRGNAMLKDFAWNTFVSKGILESYIFYREIKEKERERISEQRRLAEAEAATSGTRA